MFDDLSIKVRSYKCFEEAGFDAIKRVNLIIGKNNSGKSSLLDVIEACCVTSYSRPTHQWRNNNQTATLITKSLDEPLLQSIFHANVDGGSIRGNHWEYGRQFIDKRVTIEKSSNQPIGFKVVGCETANGHSLLDLPDYISRIASSRISIEGKLFRRLKAERDIGPEPEQAGYGIGFNAHGITNTIRGYINNVDKPRDLVEKTLLSDLNSIFNPDEEFTHIYTMKNENNTWEIFLNDTERGAIPLSESGSGIKTVISVLAYILLVPDFENKDLSEYIFGFEELENNMHPALLRRLNNYIYKKSIEHNFTYFLTTHSSVMIDQFSKQDDAQIIHVTHKDGLSKARTVETYVDNAHILDDLDIRASDVLQSNGIIWVEGPSDRIYINRWVDLWSDGEIKEGTHYQCMYYGGRILSHFSADPVQGVDSRVPMLTTNRNAAILIDSDKRTQRGHLNATKKRIIKEFEDIDAFCWVTAGKEIENYLPHDAVSHIVSTANATPCGQFVSFFDYLDGLSAGVGKRYESKKPLLAEMICPVMTRENLQGVLDMDAKMTALCEEIRSWNS